MKKVGVAILGATGSIGQQFVRLLDNHPTFDVRAITASKSKIGLHYSELEIGRPKFDWDFQADSINGIPDYAKNMRLTETSVDSLKDIGGIEIVFAGLPSDIDKKLQLDCAQHGYTVISKSSSFRGDSLVPLLVPEVNPDHLNLLPAQRKSKNMPESGAIIADPNCTTTGLVIALKPILDNVGLSTVFVTTLQAMSGAGLHALSPMSIMSNVLPFIDKEEYKLETETLKILGKYHDGNITNNSFPIHPSCLRVPVDTGHIEDVYFETRESCSVEDLKRFMRRFRGEPEELHLHTAPDQLIIVKDEKDRPQPKMDVNAGSGMSVVVGRIREQGEGFRMTLLVNNTIRGGAGMAVLNAEFMAAKGLTRTIFKEPLVN